MGRTILLMAVLVGGAAAVRDPSLYQADPNPIVNIKDTPNTTVNISLDEFSQIAKNNRPAYNLIVALLKPNVTVADRNILLRGLEEARRQEEEPAPDAAPLPTAAAEAPDASDSGPDGSGWEDFTRGTCSMLM
jgi:hypothetical protein